MSAVAEVGQVYPCAVCGKVFDSPQKRGGHQSAAHKDKQPCKICGEVYMPGMGMARHVRTTHPETVTKSKRQPCPDCGKPVMVKDMGRHRRDVHHKIIPKWGNTMAPYPSLDDEPVKGRPVDDNPAPLNSNPLTAEQITSTAAALLWPGGDIPHDMLGALLKWHTQTAVFLETVQSEEVSH